MLAGLLLSGVIVFGGIAIFFLVMTWLHAQERGFGFEDDGEGGSGLIEIPLSILYFRRLGALPFWLLIVSTALAVLCIWGFRAEMQRTRENMSEIGSISTPPPSPH